MLFLLFRHLLFSYSSFSRRSLQRLLVRNLFFLIFLYYHLYGCTSLAEVVAATSNLGLPQLISSQPISSIWVSVKFFELVYHHSRHFRWVRRHFRPATSLLCHAFFFDGTDLIYNLCSTLELAPVRSTKSKRTTATKHLFSCLTIWITDTASNIV